MSHLSVFRNYWKSFFKYENAVFIHYMYEGGIEKLVPRDQRLSALGKPRDANR